MGKKIYPGSQELVFIASGYDSMELGKVQKRASKQFGAKEKLEHFRLLHLEREEGTLTSCKITNDEQKTNVFSTASEGTIRSNRYKL